LKKIAVHYVLILIPMIEARISENVKGKVIHLKLGRIKIYFGFLEVRSRL